MIPRYYPQAPVRTKVRLMPVVAVVFAVGVLGQQHGVLDLDAGPPTATTRPATQGARPAPLPSKTARAQIPAGYLALYRSAARACPGLAWGVLAGVGRAESDHGRLDAPGVRWGVNQAGCCAGPMQFNIRNGPPSTWDRYGDGVPAHVYQPRHAIPAAVRYLCELGAGDPARRRLAVAAYNAGPAAVRQCGCVPANGETPAYVATVFAAARAYQAGGR
jgi:hypothetical protein